MKFVIKTNLQTYSLNALTAMSNILVSVIIPVYNDWKRLALCLHALSGQTLSKDRFETIIVNNSPGDTPPGDLILPANSKLIIEQKPGSYAARNAGLKTARGEVVGFTDSDCIPEKNWIKNALDYFSRHPECSRIAGKVAVFSTSKKARIEKYDMLYAFNQKGYVVGSGTSVTANLFTYKQLFDKVGYFDETLLSGGDYYWGTIADKKGYKVDYVEEIIVNHPARNTLKELVKKEKRVGASQAKFLNNNRSTTVNILRFIYSLRPRRGELKFINAKGKELKTMDKIYLCLLRHYLLSIRAFTKLRVQMGKKPNRA